MPKSYDAIVIGSGPNGLAGALVLAQAGLSVLVLERNEEIGGGARSAELTLPGFLHDLCSAIHPLAAGSPFFEGLPLSNYDLEWIHPPLPLAHPLDGGSAVSLHRSIRATAAGLGADGPRYTRLIEPLAGRWSRLRSGILAPPRLPEHPLMMARFALLGLRSAEALARGRFHSAPARALFAGLAAHSALPLARPPSAAVGLVLGTLAHAAGWPFPRGGAGRIAAALSGLLKSLGGEIATRSPVRSIDDLPPARIVLADVSPRELLQIAGHRFPPAFRRQLERYRYGPGAYKLDYALDGPIPWSAPACALAGTVHLGGHFEEILESEAAVWQGRVAPRPFVLLAQPSLFDPTRAPAGKHTAWAYCHVPNGSTADAASAIEAQIERFAPGFGARVLSRAVTPPAGIERHSSNFVGGDVNCGLQDIRQLFARPTARLYATPVPGLFLCSSATPPGGGVHGMCGYHAAYISLKKTRLKGG